MFQVRKCAAAPKSANAAADSKGFNPSFLRRKVARLERNRGPRVQLEALPARAVLPV